MSEQIGTIAIPSDKEGFVLLQCSHCGEFFKLQVGDICADDVIEIWCPCCGLKSDSYLTEDVIQLVLKKARNYAMDKLHEDFKKLEQKSRRSLVSFKAGKKPSHREEYPIQTGIESMETVYYDCCKRKAKTKALYILCGSYCPFCGVRHDEYR